MPDLFKAYVNPKFGEPVATSYYRRPPKLNERVVMMTFLFISSLLAAST